MKAPIRNHLGSNRVALTFDDGPSRWTPLILDELARNDARATFFVTTGGDPEILRGIVAGGHQVAYHCGTHVRHSQRAEDEVRREAVADLAWLAGLGVEPGAWRPPWGDLAHWSSALGRELEMEIWLWSHDTHDWDGREAAAMLAELEGTLAGGDVILMHDGIGPGALRSDVRATVDLIAPLVGLCHERGFELTPLPRTTSKELEVA